MNFDACLGVFQVDQPISIEPGHPRIRQGSRQLIQHHLKPLDLGLWPAVTGSIFQAIVGFMWA
ncbi:hypothetical protein D3C76_1200720 [compost metagenome]